jgi:hypothetical protein
VKKMSETILTILGVSKEVWSSIPEDYRQKITKAVVEKQIDLAKQLLAKVLGKGNPLPQFNPIAKAVADAFDRGFFGDTHFNMQKLHAICRKRGLVGTDVWTSKELSAPLRLFEKETKNTEEDQVDALLNGLAATIAFNANMIKRHFYAIRQGWEDRFLADIATEEKKRKKLEALVEEAESEAPTEEETEEEEE